MDNNTKKIKRKLNNRIKRNEDEKQRLRKKLKSDIKKKINRKKDIIFNIGSKGFTLIELIATIAIIAIISIITIISVTSLINSTREKSLQTAYSSLKETAVTLSKELPEDYWDIDKENNYYVSCVSVKDMKNEGYYKKDDFNNDFSRKGKIDDETFVIVKKDMDSKVIISSEIDDKGYCSSGSFNNANLKVKSYTPSTITVEADCGSDTGYKYVYSYTNKSTGKKSEDMSGIGKSFTYSGLDANTKYDLNVTCSKENSVDKHGNLEHTTGKNNEITFLNECTADSVPVTITYNDGGEYFFKLTSSGSVDSKYKARECTKTDSSSCNSKIITNVKANTWYNVSSKSIIVNINNNGTIYVYSSSNNGGVNFSSSLTNAVTLIDKSVPNVPTLSISDKIKSGKWHKNNYTINLSKSENSKANPKCKTVTYEYSIDNSNFNTISGASKSMSTEEKAKTYYFRAKSKNGNVSDSVNYVSSLDKTKPVCTFYDIKDFRKTNTKDITFTCIDTMSGVVSKNLSSSDFNLKNISIVNISSPEKISNGYKYTININADTIGNDSYIGIKSNIIYDTAGNGNSAKNSNTFKVLPNTYTVTYNSNGCGNDCNPKTKTVTYGGKYGKLCTINKTGYKFSGWYTATTGGTKITSSSTYNIESDQTLYARCSVKTVNVTFNKNDGSGETASQSFTYGASGNRFGYNTDGSYKWGNSGQFGGWDRTGYTLLGWSTDSKANSKTYGVYSGVTDDWINSNSPSITLYAVWKAKTVNVTFNKNDGSGDTASQSFTYGASGNRFGYNTDGSYKWGSSGQFGSWDRTGYTLLGWSTNSNASSATYSTYSGVADGWINSNSPSITLYAVWKENAQTINGYRCSGSDLYYITTCGLGTGICNYTHKNDYERNGTVVRSKLNYNLSSCSNYQVNNSSTYTKTINRALSLVSSSNTIKIINDNNDSSSATVSKNVTIDTNGKTVTRTSTINVNSGYTLTMNGTGGILNTSSRIFSVSGTLKIQGGTYETTGSSGNVDAVYLNDSGNIVLEDINRINLWSDYGCGAAIESNSSNAINVNATNGGIYLYGYCYGIRAPKADVSVSSSYTNSVSGVYNYIHGELGYAIAGKNIYFGTEYSKQTTSTAYYPQARSNNYMTNSTYRMAVLSASGNIYFRSGNIYSDFKAGTYQSDWDKPTYYGPGDTYNSVDIGSLITNKKVISPSGYTVKYFTSSSLSGNVIALRIVKN